MEPVETPIVRVKQVSPQRLIVLRERALRSELGPLLSHMLGDVWQFLGSHVSVTIGPAMLVHETWGVSPLVFCAGFPVLEPLAARTPFEALELPAGEAATLLSHGGYESIPAAYERLERWIEHQGRTPARPPYEIFWVDPSHAQDESELRTELVWPLRAAGS